MPEKFRPVEPGDIEKSIENFILSIKRRGQFTHSYFVLISTAIIQNELQKLLVKVMRPLSKSVNKRVFDDNGGPLNTFNGCILVTFAFKFIAEDVYRKLDCVRKVRNRFAHTTEPINLDSEELQPLLVDLGCKTEVADKLKWWVEMLQGISSAISEAGNRLP